MIKFFERRVEDTALKLLKNKKFYAWLFLFYALYSTYRIVVALYRFYKEFYGNIPWHRFFGKKKLQK